MTIAEACDKMGETLKEIIKTNWDKVTDSWDKIDTGYAAYPTNTTSSTTTTPLPTIATTSTSTPITTPISTITTTTSDWVTTYGPTPLGDGWFVVDSGGSSGTPSISYRPDPIPPSLSDMDNCIALWPDQFHSEAEADLGIFALTVYIKDVWRRDAWYIF